MSVTRLFRIGMRVAEWATPHVKEWHRKRHLNRVEGERHLDARNWLEAETHFLAALGERKHPVKKRLSLLLGLLKAQRHQKNFIEAEKTARLAVDTATLAQDHSSLMQAFDALVDLQIDQEHYEDARKTVVEITTLESAQATPDNARLAKGMRKLGTALLKSGRKPEAVEAFEQAIELSEEAFGPEHLETGNSLAELGMLCREGGDYAAAQKHLRRALSIHSAVAGAESHEATQDLYHLASALEESGDLRAAAEEYQRVLTLKERQIGGNRDETADVQIRLAGLYVLAGRTGPARELLGPAIGHLERKGGERYARALETLASIEEQSGRAADAKRLREKAASRLQ